MKPNLPAAGHAPSAEELAHFGALEARAMQLIAGSVQRPTRAPFAWAEPLLTVGVTGTNGKSSTTHLIAHAIAAAGHSVLTESTLGYWYDNEVLDVPRTSRGYLSALREAAARGARHAVCEVTSAALARGFARVWRYDLARATKIRSIAEALVRGARRGGRAHVQIELERELAIERALSAARPSDVIVIAGKGHERGQIALGVEREYSDHDCVARLLSGARTQIE